MGTRLSTPVKPRKRRRMQSQMTTAQDVTPRARLNRARSDLRYLKIDLAPRYQAAIPHIESAMDTLKRALQEILIADADKPWEQPK